MAAANIVNLTKDNFASEVLQASTPVLVDFWAEWCGPCKMIAPVLDELAGEYDGKVKIGKVNIDNEQALAAEYGIRAIPTLLLLFFSLGIGLLISTWAIYFPDVSEMYQIIVSAWMYLSPVIYNDSMLPPDLQFWFSRLNPMYSIISLFRLPIYDGRLPTWEEFWPSLIISLGVLVVGWVVFTARSDEFAYRV